MPNIKLKYDENKKEYSMSNNDNQVVEILRDEELKLLEKFDLAPMILFNDKEVLYLNNSCREMLGYKEENILRNKTVGIFEIFDKKNFIQHMYNILDNAIYPIKQEISMFKKNKDEIWVELTRKIIVYNSQRCIFASLEDITHLRKLELELSRISKLRTLMLEISRFAIKIEDINKLFQLILENALNSIENGTVGTILIKEGDYFTVASQIGFCEDIKDFYLPEEDAFLYKATNGKMDKIANIPDLMTFSKYYPIKTNYGEERYIKSTLTAPIYVKGNLFGMINIDSIETNSFDEDDVKSMEFIRNYIEIILSNYLLYKEKSYLARYDQLTKFYNRYYFDEQAEMIIEKALLNKESFSLVVFDINNLKKVNDSLGHLAGDEVIKKFAYELKNNIRKTDIVGRLGGDEFAGVFLNTDIESLNEKFLNLLMKMEKDPISINGEQIKYTFSYGIASFPKEAISLKDLIKIADNRMYIFKGKYKKQILQIT